MEINKVVDQFAIAEVQKKMLETLQGYGITDADVLKIMGRIPRHLFIPDGEKNIQLAYGDHPCDIGFKQTISQPYMVAYMSELLRIKKGEKVLEIGTGSGYQAVVLAALGAEVFTIEIIRPLADRVAHLPHFRGYRNIHLSSGDGHSGWPEHSPYQAIIATCAPQTIPSALISQLDEGGRLVLPLGEIDQQLVVICKNKGKIRRKNDLAVRFVPMLKEDL